MGVRVHEAWHDDAAGGIQGRFVRIGGLQFLGWPDDKDLIVADEHCAVFEDAEAAKVGSALGTTRKGQELGGGVNEHDRFILPQEKVILPEVAGWKVVGHGAGFSVALWGGCGPADR